MTDPNIAAAIADVKTAVAEARALIDPVPAWLIAPYAAQMTDVFARLADATARLEKMIAPPPPRSPARPSLRTSAHDRRTN